MIFHDGNCQEFNMSHVPADKANPHVWGLSKASRREVPPEHPVSGWRFATILHVNGTIVLADDFDGDNETFWEDCIGAPRAKCDAGWLNGHSMSDVAFRALRHREVPDPDCECGYRIVRSVTELSRFMRWSKGDLAPFPVSELPEETRGLVAGLGDVVHQSVVLVSVLGCGTTCAAEFDHYRDPDGTVRVEWLAATRHFVANEGDPVVDALTDWGAVVSVVPDVSEVHEVGDCEARAEQFRIWRLGSPAPVDGVVLSEGAGSVSGDSYTETGRFGEFGAAGAAIVSDGKVLLVWSNSRWQLPGGARMADESVGECVVRETFEETGVDLAGVPVRAAFERLEPGGWSYTTVVVDAPAGVVPMAVGEVSDVGWFSEPPVGAHPDLIETWGLL